MGGRVSAITAPSSLCSTVSDTHTVTGGTALGGRDRKEGLMIAAMVVLLIVQAFLIVRVVIG